MRTCLCVSFFHPIRRIGWYVNDALARCMEQRRVAHGIARSAHKTNPTSARLYTSLRDDCFRAYGLIKYRKQAADFISSEVVVRIPVAEENKAIPLCGTDFQNFLKIS